MQNINGYMHYLINFYFLQDGKMQEIIVNLGHPRSPSKDGKLGDGLVALVDPYGNRLGAGKRITRQCGWFNDCVFVDEDGNLCHADFYEKFSWTTHVGKMLLI